MRKIFYQNFDGRRYAEITEPVYQTPKGMPLGVVNMGFARVFAVWKSMILTHRGFVCMYVQEGEGTVDAGPTHYHLKKGDILCYRTANTQVVMTALKAPWVYRWIDVDGAASLFYYSKLQHISCGEEYFLYYYDRLLNNLLVSSAGECYKNCSILTELFSEILCQPRQSPREEGQYADNFFQLFCYMETRYSSSITVDELAQVLGFSKFHFMRIFKSHTNLSPMQYLKNFRMGKAAELLILSDRSVEEIAAIVGYNSPSRFIAHFKETLSTTPLQYRKKNKK